MGPRPARSKLKGAEEMKRALPFILTLSFLFFQANAVKKMEGQEGQTVTLYANTTALQISFYHWDFKRHNRTETIIRVNDGEIIKIPGTRFEDRLQTDVRTGSITILNLTLNDSGTFEAHIFTNRGNIFHSVKLIVKDSNGYIENYLVGTNVTLRSRLERLEKDYVTSWFFGPDPGREIASSQKCPSKHGDIFDNLSLNQSNGDLTILQITKSFRGTYFVKTWIGGYPHSTVKYDIRVYDHVSVPNITNSTAQPTSNVCVATCSVENGADVNLTWYRGDIGISHTSNQNISTLTLLVEIQPEDASTYSCQTQNPVSVERRTLRSEWLPCHNSGTAEYWVIVPVPVVILLIICVGIYVCIKRNRGEQTDDSQRSQSNFETSPPSPSSSQRSEEYLLQNFQRPSYETANPTRFQT